MDVFRPLVRRLIRRHAQAWKMIEIEMVVRIDEARAKVAFPEIQDELRC